MKLRFTLRATDDLTDIADYIGAHDLHAALRVRGAILDAIEALSAFPALGRKQDIDGVRKLPARRFPYLIYYLVDDAAEEIVVLTIRHAARQRIAEDN